MANRIKGGPTALQRKIRDAMDEAAGRPVVEDVLPPFESLPFKERARHKLTPLMDARKKAAMYAGWYRDDVFDSWVRKFLVIADDPRQWTQSQVLYDNYAKAAALKEAGSARSEMGMTARSEIATQTQWGLMMATKFTKKRRTKGWYYPVRIVREA